MGRRKSGKGKNAGGAGATPAERPAAPSVPALFREAIGSIAGFLSAPFSRAPRVRPAGAVRFPATSVEAAADPGA
jgi:hypothetical protein